ncbi:uncharacterized protein LOC122852461 isoform X3 [Aphidius gifuensis]|uniref:uncharacterized protein LOC122852461 isoform X3 n=1 Tax=Aphidius gifuensis TaxID=684658 RepID=UPI001CDC3ACB|nr:uncharacterized protein LOC122852461 isoform X3 [Aphidius gifuensis]
MARKCCVKNCDIDDNYINNNEYIKFHNFTYNSDDVKNNWIVNCDIDNCELTLNIVICNRHFKRTDYETIKGHELILKKNAVPSVFHDYDKHPDPITMPVRILNGSYNQQDLDKNKSIIPNLNRTESPSLNDSSGETCNSRPESSTGSIHQLESSDDIDNDIKQETNVDNEEETLNVINLIAGEKKNITDDTILPIIESFDTSINHYPVDKIINDELLDDINLNNLNDDDKNCQPAVSCNGLTFFIGSRLEAKDYHNQWFPAKVVEIDWTEREILIHFDKWNSRYDEWIPIDSSRLRKIQPPSSEQTLVSPTPNTNMREFIVGDRVLATWADGRKYPARVCAVLGNDRYDVLFDDGYAKVVKSSKMTKIADTSNKKETTMEQDTYIGSKQERRDKKRKHTVIDLFSRKKTKSETPEKQIIKKEDTLDIVDTINGDNNEAETTVYYDSGVEQSKNFDSIKQTKQKIPKIKKESPKYDLLDQDDDSPEWVDGEPKGVESFTVDGNNGTRRSIIVADKRIPDGWERHFTQRRSGNSAGKWDVLFMHIESGKKFRTKSDVRTFFHTQLHTDFDPEMFDFCIHRKKRLSIAKPKIELSSEPTKKIKTLLPKTKLLLPQSSSSSSCSSSTSTSSSTLTATSTTPSLTSSIDNSSLTPAGSMNTPATPFSSVSTPVNNTSVYIGSLKIEMVDDSYKCPKEGCAKTVRKENLLQMHVKHYHPEYAKYLGSTPNVADLAYARTIGEPVVDATPKSRFSEKRKSLQEKPIALSFVNSPSQSVSVASTVISDNNIVSDTVNGHVNDIKKFEMMSPTRNLDHDDDVVKRNEANCAMSPGTLFDMKIREEKTQTGIKTLLPVRSIISTDVIKNDKLKLLDETHIEKGRGHRKRQLSEYSSDASTKSKKRQGILELTDDYGDLDDSALDAEGPAEPVYRFSRRKSDTKSDDNSQSSQLNDSPDKKIECTPNDNYQIMSEDGEGVMMMINGEMVKVEQLKREEIINCTCGYSEEDGLMIQCDLCLCWQHGHCNEIEREKDVPDKYICYICRHPYRQRPSQKYIHDQDWIKEGKLPILSNRTKDQTAINKRTAMLKRSYDLVGSLLKIQQMLHSLRVKINIARNKDHPKLYLWSKNWDKSDIVEKDTNPIPILEIIKKQEDNELSINLQNNNNNSIKEEIIDDQKIVEKNSDDKLISSDSELMKILEEDTNTMSDDLKMSIIKKEDIKENIFHDVLLKSDDKLFNCDDKKFDDFVNFNDNDLIDKKTFLDNENIDIKPMLSMVPAQPFIPEPEAPINPAECRLRLLEHVEHFQKHLDALLTNVEVQVCALEAMDSDDTTQETDIDPKTKQTIQMLMRDLNSLRKLAALC